jgi:hypothetical protein
MKHAGRFGITCRTLPFESNQRSCRSCNSKVASTKPKGFAECGRQMPRTGSELDIYSIVRKRRLWISESVALNVTLQGLCSVGVGDSGLHERK